jgi:hypothetical protein
MKIDKQFNTFTVKEYFFYIENQKKYSDFNTLGLYRSLSENEKISIDEKIRIREFAHTFFQKTFDFLVLKDPLTYMTVVSLGLEMTKADEKQLWKDVEQAQLKILTEKKLGHRNFGTYSKHICGHEGCPLDGLMTQKGSYISYHDEMRFDTDNRNYGAKNKSEKLKKERKNEKKIIVIDLES